MISLSNVTFAYPGNSMPVVKGMSLKLETPGIYGLLGANGTGKSTLLYLISGLLKPRQGSVSVNGRESFLRLPSMLSEVFLVPEELSLPNVTLNEFVKVTAPFYPHFDYTLMERYLELFRLSTDIHLGRLSMGQKKKAFVAFALACRTKVLLMDEPTNGLDIPGKNEFRRALIEEQDENRIVVISTHQVRDLDRVLDHVMIVSKDGVALDASIADLQRRYLFLFSHDPADCAGALWSMPVAGGYNIIRRRSDSDQETDVNIESLFEFTFSNSEPRKL